MIQGGELSSEKLVFDAGYHNAALYLQSVFCARADFFLVPPYNERVDIKIHDRHIVFTKHEPGTGFVYEDAREIIQKAQRFGQVPPQLAAELVQLAQENLPVQATLFFPDERRTMIECAVFLNWVRLIFRGEKFASMAQKVAADLQNHLPPGLTVSTNQVDELVIRRDDGERLLMTNGNVKKLAAVLLSYVLLPPELHARFILNFSQFSVMQSTRLFLHHTLHELKEAESVGGKIHTNLTADHAVRILKILAENGGAFDQLEDRDGEFLAHVQLFHDKEYEAFSGVRNLKPFMRAFVESYGSEIRALQDIRLLEGGADVRGQVGRDKATEIDGHTMQEISAEKNRHRLNPGGGAKQIKDE